MSKKILLICSDKREVELRKVINESFENCVIDFTKNLDDAVDKIVANGFDMTVLDADSRVKSRRLIDIKDIIRLNFISRKHVLIITKNLEKWQKSKCSLSIAEQSGIRVCESQRDKIISSVQSTWKENIPSHGEVFQSIMSEIKSNEKASKKSIFHKLSQKF